jgi:hypothetical protein
MDLRHWIITTGSVFALHIGPLIETIPGGKGSFYDTSGTYQQSARTNKLDLSTIYKNMINMIT